MFCSEYYYPNLGGVQNHIKLIAEFLPRNQFEVEIATSFDHKRIKKKINFIKVNQFNIYGNLVTGYHGETRKYQDFLLKNKFDIIIFYAAQQWSFDLSLPIIEKIKGKKIFLPCGFSKIKNIFYFPYFWLLMKKINFFDKIICFSKHYRDYDFCKKYYDKNIHIIPNAGFKSDKKFIKKNYKNSNILKILNVGKLSYMKNQLYLILASFFLKRKIELNFYYNNKSLYYYIFIFFSTILKYFKNTKTNIYFNQSKEKILNAYLYNDIFIFTSKVECSPLVIYDSVANCLPFICSDVGNVKEIAKKSKIGTIYNNFFHLVRLINDFKIQKKIRNDKKFTWKIQLEEYKKKFLSIYQNK